MEGNINKKDIDESILQSIDKLSQEQELNFFDDMFQVTSRPVGIQEFIESDDYMGRVFSQGLYQYWKTQINEVFPDPYRINCQYLVLGGAIGSGKTTFGILVTEYILYKMSLLKNPLVLGALMPTTILRMIAIHQHKHKAKTTIYDKHMDNLKNSPYFARLCGENLEHGLPHNINLFVGKDRNDVISKEIFLSHWTECNFFNRDKAKELFDELLNRMASRFVRYQNYFSLMIFDSSTTVEDSFLNEFLADNIFKSNTITFSPASWDVKPELYWSEPHKWVYLGDSKLSPFFHDSSDKPDLPSLQEDRLIKVPGEEYVVTPLKSDIYRAIQDILGKSTIQNDKFFKDYMIYERNCTLDMLSIPDKLNISYNSELTLLDYTEKLLDTIPKDVNLYIGLDIGLVNDLTGLTVAYCEEYRTFSINGNSIKKPVMKVPLCLGIGRIDGEETPLNKVEEFIGYLSRRFHVKKVFADRFNSAQMFQNLNSLYGITCENKSTVTNSYCYEQLKTLLTEDRIKIVKNNILIKEFDDIIYVPGTTNKVDHTPKGSKDLLDSLAIAVVGCLEDGENIAIRKQKENNLTVIKSYRLLNNQNHSEVNKFMSSVNLFKGR